MMPRRLSWLQLVDGMFCAISVLLVLLLIQRFGDEGRGHLPQEDFRITCDVSGDRIDDFRATFSGGNIEPATVLPNELSITLDQVLTTWPALALRVTIPRTPRNAYCVSVIRQAIDELIEQRQVTDRLPAFPIYRLEYAHSPDSGPER